MIWQAWETYSLSCVVQSQNKHVDFRLGEEISNQPGDERELGKQEGLDSNECRDRMRVTMEGQQEEQSCHHTATIRPYHHQGSTSSRSPYLTIGNALSRGAARPAARCPCQHSPAGHRVICLRNSGTLFLWPPPEQPPHHAQAPEPTPLPEGFNVDKMARKDLPHALTLERFAAGKDGRANAFKKKKQGESL